jgi:hypothetical protein
VSASNGVIRIGRKGVKEFAFGEEGKPFKVDVVATFQDYVALDDSFRPEEEDADGNRSIPMERIPEYQQAVFDFCAQIAGEAGGPTSRAEALDFVARLREQYDELAVFFRPKSREGPDSRGTSEAQSELRFSEEPAS